MRHLSLKIDGLCFNHLRFPHYKDISEPLLQVIELQVYEAGLRKPYAPSAGHRPLVIMYLYCLECVQAQIQWKTVRFT